MEKKLDFKKILLDIEDYLLTKELSASDNSLVEKIKFKLRNVIAITENVDPELYYSMVEPSFNSLSNYCSYFIKGNSNYLSSINSCIGKILSDLMIYIDFNILFGDKNGIKNNVKYYKTEITKQKKLLDDEYSLIKEEIAGYRKNLEDNNSDLNAMLKDLNNKINDLQLKQNNLNNSIDSLLTESKDKINNYLDVRKTEIKDKEDYQEKYYKDKFDILIKEYDSKFNDSFNENVEKYDNMLNEISIKNEEVSNLLNIVSDKVRIGQYKKSADFLRIERFIWQALTIILFVTSFILMLCITFSSKDFSKYVIIKYVISAILMGSATYTGKQASNCRKDETYYRKQELELASIDTYLATMDVVDRTQIKKELSSKLFGQAQKTYTDKYDEKDVFTPDILVKIVDLIKKEQK